MPATTQDLLRRDSERGAGLSPPTGGASAQPNRRTRTTARTATARPSGRQGETQASRCGQRGLGDLEGLEQPVKRVAHRRGASPSSSTRPPSTRPPLIAKPAPGKQDQDHDDQQHEQPRADGDTAEDGGEHQDDDEYFK